MKKVSIIVFLAFITILCGCKSESQKHLDSELSRTRKILEEVAQYTAQCQKNVTAETVAKLESLCSNPDLNINPGFYDYDDAQQAQISRQQNLIDSIRVMAETACQLYIDTYFKELANEELLIEERKTYPLYLTKGSKLIINYSPSGQIAAKFYNADSRSLIKTYSNTVSDTLEIKNNAIYLFELTSTTPQYASVQLLQKVNSVDEFIRSYTISVEQIETTVGAFRAKKIPGVDMVPIFEEPHKYTLRSQLKNFWDGTGQCRSIAALKVPSGASDILYHLRVSTDDDGRSSDGEFFDDVYTHYKKVKLFGLPLYEKAGNHNGLLRELLNGCQVQREEKAYCNLYVFNSSVQAKKFQDNEDLSKLSYNMDFSASGTQSRNERISAKGFQTIYLGFENPRQTHDVYLWVEALAVIPKDVYYTEKYTLK